jgi:acetyltransferase-like isoleucine patch superfamily enzyme
LWSFAYREPIFRSLCESVGEHLYLEQTPQIGGRPRIIIGDDVTISGDLSINANHILDQPLVSIGDGVFLGHRLTIQVARAVSIQSGTLIAANCFIADHDGHPSSYADRNAGRPAPLHEVKPVSIGRNVWIGRECIILKGVTIGDGAVVGAGSVVRTDVPSFSLVFGNPARVVRDPLPEPQS